MKGKTGEKTEGGKWEEKKEKIGRKSEKKEWKNGRKGSERKGERDSEKASKKTRKRKGECEEKWEKQRGEINSFVVYILNSVDTKSQIKQYIYTNRLASADITIISNTNYTLYY